VRGFDRAAERYERSRPSYPSEAVRYLGRHLRLGSGRTIVELGSGTGKLTRSLVATGAAVVAIEPTAGMRRVFRRVLPGTVVLAGTAEAIPLPDAFADAVVVGQAFHWFRTGPALREIARVLAPDGGLGLLWNLRDESVGYARRLSELIDRFGGRVAHARELRWLGPFRRSRAGFGPLRHRQFEHAVPMTLARLVDRVLSVSAISVLRPGRQQALAREVRRLVASDPDTAGQRVVRMPYRTDVYVARRTR
jgi:SAM-dependent methyltransferase